MPAEYAMGYRKPPVSGQFRKGQSGNPGGRPKVRPRPTRTQRFAQMLETDLLQSTEELATTPCRTALAAGAKGMVLDMVRGKTAVIRMIFTFMDELDVMEGNLVRTRRARPVRIPEWAEADDGDETASLDEQGLGEETPLPMWGEFASEVPSSGMKTESPPAAGDKGARPLTEGNEQGVETESERQFLAVSRRVPSEKELRRREEQAEMERGRQAYESARATVKAFAEKHGYEFPGTGSAEPVKDAPLPLTEGRSQGITNSRPEEGPYKRALRERFERLAAAEREEAARKAAKAESLLMLRQAQHEDNLPRPEPGPPVQPGEGRTNTRDPEPLPDFAIWMRGQQAAP